MRTFTREAMDRNYVIYMENSHLPAYCIWREEDIYNETREERIDWWGYFMYKHDIEIIYIAYDWTVFLTNLKLDNDQKGCKFY